MELESAQKIIQVEADVICTRTNCGGHSLSSVKTIYGH